MSRGAFKRIHDPIEMILWVRLEIRIPDGFLTEDDVAIDYRRHFSIAATEVKADAAAIQMPTERSRMRLFWWWLRRRNYFQGSINILSPTIFESNLPGVLVR